MADRCAPSRQLAEGFEYEEMFFNGMLDKGWAIVMTDYQGLGTPGTHTYMNRQAQAHAVLDGVRAAQRMGVGLDATNPVALAGYSQGGGASAAAGELAPSYAPELEITAVSAGAAPADLRLTGEKIDGSMWSAFLSYSALSLSADYGIDPAQVLDEKGLAHMREIEASCALEMLPFAFTRSSTLTQDGRPLTAYLAEDPFRTAVEDNRIGRLRPTVPTFVYHSVVDDAIPYEAGKGLARDWCAQGVNVKFTWDLAPGHAGGMASYALLNLRYLSDRFAGKAQANECWKVR